MQPLIEHRLELAGYATRALELEGTGPPLLLLHGFADSADTWRRALDRLARAGRRALAVDFPGFGAADPLTPGAVLPQLDAFAAEAVRHLRAESGQAPVVVGNSLGGCVALRLGEHGLELGLAGVVPVAPAGLEHPGWFRVIETAPLVRALLSSPVPLPERVVRSAVAAAYRQLVFARPREAAREGVSAFTDHHRRPRVVAGYLDTGRRLLPELAAPFHLEAVDAPVLLVWGAEDRMVSSRGARRILDALGERGLIEYVLFERCGHCPQIEEPDRFAELLLRFAASPAQP